MRFLCVLFVSNSARVRNSSVVSVISPVKVRSSVKSTVHEADAKRKCNEHITETQRMEYKTNTIPILMHQMETEPFVNLTYIYLALYAAFVRPKF
jgi:hypothetical protein